MRHAIQKIGLVINTQHPKAAEVGRRIRRVAMKLGAEVVMESRSAALMQIKGRTFRGMMSAVDGVVVAGGDGTLLKTVAHASVLDRPVLGVALGSLGFLTPLPPERIDKGLADFISGEWDACARTILEVRLKRRGDAEKNGRFLGYALNEVVLSRFEGARLVHLSAWVDDELVTVYSADGVIVATPTGSTAYSLSSHGAILTPDAPVLCLTPVCPHTLTNRPVIFSERSVVRMAPDQASRLRVTLDGHRTARVPEDGEIEIRASERKLRWVQPKPYRFFEVLRNKLNWRGSATR